jgi:hypothetical protein
VKHQHTSTATSILTTKSTYRSLSAQQFSELTVFVTLSELLSRKAIITSILRDFSENLFESVRPTVGIEYFQFIPSHKFEWRTQEFFRGEGGGVGQKFS